MSDFKAMKFRVSNDEGSRLIQNVLFGMGYVWYGTGSTQIQFTYAPYLYTDERGRVSYGTSDDFFLRQTEPEYTLYGADTIRPLEDDSTDAATAITAPPVGLRPQHIVTQERLYEVLDAMRRYVAAGLAIPDEWNDELIKLRVSYNVHSRRSRFEELTSH